MFNRQPVYLRPSIQIEPLIDRWYAWPHLLPPATVARNLTQRHLSIFDSYLANPQAHADAIERPEMIGGPFVDYKGRRTAEIRTLRDETVQKRALLIQLSHALGELDNILRLEGKGYALQPLYSKVPADLRGYVELIYDLNHHPSFRLLEALLYRSPYYMPDMQSLMLSETSGDDRPFILSTPRLDAPNAVHLQVPFESDFVDTLSQSKIRPRPLDWIRKSMSALGEQEALFNGFFTTDPPKPYLPYTGPGVRWRYFGHACILVETCGCAILLDPVLSYTYESTISRYTYLDLPDRIDYVLLTHSHQDHILIETLLQIRHKVQHVVVPRSGGGGLQDPSLKLMFRQMGFRNVIEMGELEEKTGNGLVITALPFFGEHCDLDVRAKLAYLVRTPKHSIMFAADSCNIEPTLYGHLAREVGPVDALFLGMECDGAPVTWLYGPLLTRPIERGADQSRRLAGCNYDQAIDLVDRMKCKEVYVYAMGQEPWLNYVMSIKYTDQSRPIIESNRLLLECAKRNIVAERLFGEKEILM